jgi:glycine oxidase
MTIVVVGGGIIGCATALELARAGARVAVLERGVPGGEASSAAAGLLAPLGESSVAAFRELAVASWRLYPKVVEELRELTGVDVEYVTRGTLYPVVSLDDEREAQAWALGPEFRVEVWDRRDIDAREPALSPRVRKAIFVRGDHWLNNERLVAAYVRAALDAGVDVRPGTEVTGLWMEGDRVRGVHVGGEGLEAEAVVLAAGAWTARLAPGPRALPVEPRRGQMVALVHVPPVLTHCVHGEAYLVPRPSGELLVGATVERAGFQRAVTAQGVAGLLRAALDLVPSLGELAVSRTWSGFRPWAPDGLPILGPWPGVRGLWVATAHFRNGILLAPITARLMSEWILAGRPSMELTPFLPDRFLGDGAR